MAESYKMYAEENASASCRRCEALLSQLGLILYEKLGSAYLRSGGFDEFLQDLSHIGEKYNTHKCLGEQVMTSSVNVPLMK